MAKNEEEAKWPSERIPQGGLFHPPKVKYSKETNDLLNVLMEESRLSMMLRKTLNYHLRNGEPLPLPEIKKSQNQTDEEDKIAFEIMQRAHNDRKKSLESIKASGAYDQPRYRPKPDSKIPRDTAKLKLQESMSGMKLPLSNLKAKRKSSGMKNKRENITLHDQVDELLQEIDERAEWLAEMEAIGEGKKYLEIIHGQIAGKIREIRALQKKMDNIERVTRLKEIQEQDFKL